MVDDVVKVDDDDAFETARALASQEGLMVGISSGANMWAAKQVAARPEWAGKRLSEIAQAEEIQPLDLVLQIAGNGGASIVNITSIAGHAIHPFAGSAKPLNPRKMPCLTPSASSTL